MPSLKKGWGVSFCNITKHDFIVMLACLRGRVPKASAFSIVLRK